MFVFCEVALEVEVERGANRKCDRDNRNPHSVAEVKARSPLSRSRAGALAGAGRAREENFGHFGQVQAQADVTLSRFQQLRPRSLT